MISLCSARRVGAAVMVNMPSLEEVGEQYGAWKNKTRVSNTSELG
jgi:hypothetical protein